MHKGDGDGVETLSHSLGGKSFSTEFVDTISSDEDDDANASSSNQIAKDEVLYLITATGIEYNPMPHVPQYTRQERGKTDFQT